MSDRLIDVRPSDRSRAAARSARVRRVGDADLGDEQRRDRPHRARQVARAAARASTGSTIRRRTPPPPRPPTSARDAPMRPATLERTRTRPAAAAITPPACSSGIATLSDAAVVASVITASAPNSGHGGAAHCGFCATKNRKNWPTQREIDAVPEAEASAVDGRACARRSFRVRPRVAAEHDERQADEHEQRRQHADGRRGVVPPHGQHDPREHARPPPTAAAWRRRRSR